MQLEEVVDALISAGQIPKEKVLGREDVCRILNEFPMLNEMGDVGVLADALLNAGSILKEKKVDVEKKKITLKNAQPLIDKIKNS